MCFGHVPLHGEDFLRNETYCLCLSVIFKSHVIVVHKSVQSHACRSYSGSKMLPLCSMSMLVTGGPLSRSDAQPEMQTACCSSVSTTTAHQAKAAGYERHTTSDTTQTSLQQLAYCASRISRHTAEAKQTSTVSTALSMVQSLADAPSLAKRLSLCVLAADVDLWTSNWSNLYQLDGMRIGGVKPDLFLGHSIGPQLGTVAVILQPDKSCYHVDWYVPKRLVSKLKSHGDWARLLPGSTWL